MNELTTWQAKKAHSLSSSMNVRDPFNLHSLPAIHILQGRATRTATHVAQRVLDAGAQAYETGRHALEEMTLSIPNNVPSFSTPQQREMENRAWESAGMSARSSRSGNGGVVKEMQDKMGSLFGEREADLPMYKDKPYTYAASRRKQPLWKRRRGWGLIAFVGLLWYMLGAFQVNKPRAKSGWFSFGGSTGGMDWLDRRERVKEAFTQSWDAYERYAWGMFGSMNPLFN